MFLNKLVKYTTFTLAIGASSLAIAETGSTSVVIQNQVITLTEIASLDFGILLPFGRNGYQTVVPTGNQSGPVRAHQTGTVAPAQWDVTGVPGAPYDVALPANGAVIVSNGTETMSVDNFSHTLNNNQLYIDGAGNATFNVGATLYITANQAQGNYTGTYDVTVSYN